MAFGIQTAVLAVLAVLALSFGFAAAGAGDSHTALSNGLGFHYKYDIAHGHHGHAAGLSHPNGYGGFGSPGYHVGGAYYAGY